MLRFLSLILSVALHAGVLAMAFLWPSSPTVRLDMPVYEVNLVSLGGGPVALPQVSAQPNPQVAKPAAVPQVQEPVSQAVSQPDAQAAKPIVIPKDDKLAKPEVQAEATTIETPKPKADPKPEPVSTPEPKSNPKPAPIPQQPAALPVAPKAESKPDPKPESKPELKAETKPTPKPEPKKSPKKEPTEEDILAEALGTAKKSVQPEEKKKQAPTKTGDEVSDLLTELRGEVEANAQASAAAGASFGVSDGNVVEGSAEAIYIEKCRVLIQLNWRTPPSALRKNIKAKVKITIDDTGKILNVTIDESSGRTDYDSSIQQACWRTAVLPIPITPDCKKMVITFHPTE